MWPSPSLSLSLSLSRTCCWCWIDVYPDTIRALLIDPIFAHALPPLHPLHLRCLWLCAVSLWGWRQNCGCICPCCVVVDCSFCHEWLEQISPMHVRVHVLCSVTCLIELDTWCFPLHWRQQHEHEHGRMDPDGMTVVVMVIGRRRSRVASVLLVLACHWIRMTWSWDEEVGEAENRGMRWGCCYSAPRWM